jgi:hypothetical protein
MGHLVSFRAGAASILLPILTAVSLTSCGGSSNGHAVAGHLAASRPGVGHSGVSPAAVSASPTSTSGGSLTNTAAIAFADAVNLTSADLSEPPAFTGSPANEDGTEKASGELSRCEGAHDPRPAVAEVSSESFKRKGPDSVEALSSTVVVMPTAALAGKDLAAILNSRGESCIESELNKTFARKDSEQINYSRVSMVDRALEVPGVSGGVELNISTMVTKVGGAGTVYIDILGFIDGPAEVFLTAVGTPQPITPAFEEHLISVLSKRARTHGG